MTILLAGDRHEHREVLTRLEEWGSGAYLRPFVSCLVSEGAGLDDEDLIGRSHRGVETVGVPLTQAIRDLGDEPIQVVALQVWSGATEAELVAESVRIDGIFQQLLRVVGQAAHMGQGLPAITVSVPVLQRGADTQAEPVPAGALQPGLWDAHVVLDPTDMVSPSAVAKNALLLGEDRVGHAALGICAVAGLWRTSSDGWRLSEAVAAQLMGEEPPVYIARAHHRVIDAGFVLDHLASRVVLATGDQWPMPFRADGHELRAPKRDKADQWAQRFASSVGGVDNGALRYRRMVFKPEQKYGVKFWEAIVKFLRFAVGLVLRWPKDKILQITHDAEERVIAWANGEIFGENSEFVITRDGKDQVIDPDFELTFEGESLAARFDAMGESDPSPETWRALRGVSFALVDGSKVPAAVLDSMPDDQARAWEQSPIAIPWPAVISASPEGPPIPLPNWSTVPGGPLQAWGGRRVGPFDAWAVGAIVATLQSIIASRPAPDPEEGAEPETLPVDELLRSILAWRSVRAATFLWQAAEHLARERQAAADDVRAKLKLLLEALELGPAGRRDQEKTERARLGRKFRWIGIAITILVVGSVIAGNVLLASIGTAVLVFGGVAVWLFGILLTVYRWAAAMYRLENERLAKNPIAEAKKALQHAAREYDRLTALDADFQEVAELISWVVHRPWGQVELDAPEYPTPLDATHLPVAFQVRTGVATEKRVASLTERAHRQHFEIGWMSKLYKRAEDRSITSAIDLGRTEQEAEAAVRPDIDDRSFTYRADLLDHVRRGVHARAEVRRVTDALAEQCAELSPTDLLSDVLALDDTDVGGVGHDGGLDRRVRFDPSSALLPPLRMSTADVVRAVSPSLVKVMAGSTTGSSTGSGVVWRDGMVVTNAHVIADAERIQVETSTGSVLDVTEHVADPDADLAVLSVPGLDAPLLAPETAPPAVGDPVIAIGYPLGLAGSASASVGIISALGRSFSFESGVELTDLIQTDAATNPGSSGGALVNLAGRLVGVTTGGAPGMQGINVAIPSAQVVEVTDGLVEGTSVENPSGGSSSDLGSGAAGRARVGFSSPVSVDERAADEAGRARIRAFFGDLFPSPENQMSGALLADLADAEIGWRFVTVPQGVTHPDADVVVIDDDTKPSLAAPYRIAMGRLDVCGPLAATELRLIATPTTSEGGDTGDPRFGGSSGRHFEEDRL